MFNIYPVHAFNDNYIWLIHSTDDNLVAAVDPGDAKPVLEALEQLELPLAAIFITHHHWDHTGGIDDLLAVGKVPVYGPISRKIPQVTQPLAEGDKFEFANTVFRIMEVPGHTLDHIAYYSDEDGEAPLLFCGDTLFGAGCGRLFEGTPQQMYQSLNRLAALPDETRVFCTHEYTLSNLAFARCVESCNTDIAKRVQQDTELRNNDTPTLPTSIAREKLTNPFLRCQQQAVVTRVSNHAGSALSPGADTFAQLRSWKDQFVV